MTQTQQKLLLILTCFLFFFKSFATTIYGGNVSGTWTLANSPYTVYGACYVPSGSSLVIEAGCVIRFAEHARITVEGSIHADGTATDSIKMEYAGTNAWFNHISPSPGWWGIRINNYSLPLDSSSISYCDIQGFRQNDATNDTTSGLLQALYTHLYFAHNRVHHNVADSPNMGVYYHGSTGEVAHCEMMENMSSGGILSIFQSQINVHHNHIHHNYNDLQSSSFGAKHLTPGVSIFNNSTVVFSFNDIHHHINTAGAGGGLVSQGGIVLYHNRFYENHAQSGGGAVYLSNGVFSYEGTNDILVEGNLFANNNDSTDTFPCGITDGGAGAFISQNDCDSCKSLIINNIFANNRTGFWGGGLRLYKTHSKVINNNFVNNKALVHGGGLHIFNSPGKQVFAKNNIFWGNVADSIFYPNENITCEGLYGTMIFEYNHTEYPFNNIMWAATPDSVLSTANNTAINSPLFIAPTTVAGLAQNGATANWGLYNLSPCINAGDTANCNYSTLDYLGQGRMVNQIDVGAIEYRQVESADFITDKEADVLLFPNPTSDNLHLSFTKEKQNVMVQIYDITGKFISSQEFETPEKELFISTTHLKEGLYSLLIKTEKGISTHHFVKK